MKKLSLLLLSIVLATFSCLAKEMPEYEIEGAGTGAQGTYLVKVTIISKDKKPSDEEFAKCAVHGILFRGFSNKELRQQQRPLAGSAASEAQHTDYYSNFFADGGVFKNYVESVSGSRSVMKSGKKYRVSMKISVNKEQLRKDLEQAGVIRGLNSAF